MFKTQSTSSGLRGRIRGGVAQERWGGPRGGSEDEIIEAPRSGVPETSTTRETDPTGMKGGRDRSRIRKEVYTEFSLFYTEFRRFIQIGVYAQ